jgi:UDP-hydrolysing UDP-N-acetyl-D-glucosamine 2-epimerase
MKTKRKICVVITARPSYSRIKTALHAIVEHPGLELQLVVAGSALLERYGTAAKYIAADGFQIAARVYDVLEGETLAAMAKTTGLGLLELSTVFDNLKPDVVLTIADRFETLATSIAAAFMNIPLVHTQGGEVTGSIDEKVRHANTKLADLHFVTTEKSRERVLKMGEDPTRVFVTGCPSIDLASQVLKDPTLDFDPLEKYGGVGKQLDLSRGYLVVMQHPVTTEYEQALSHVTETLHAVAESGLPTMWFWPNVDAGSDGTSKGLRRFREMFAPRNIHFFKNMWPIDFLKVLANSRGIVGNSSVAIREAAYLGVPAVNIGTRQTGRDRGRNVVDVGYDRNQILAALKRNFEIGKYPSDDVYGSGNSGKKMADLLDRLPLSIEKTLTY